MLNVPLLSQRDPRWAGKLLGTSNTTVGGYGCLLTALTSLAGQTDVDKANELFKQNNVFAQGNLVIWAYVPKALPNLKFIYRNYTYDNTKVADYVYNKRIPVVVEVDAAPIGSPKTSHFVLYLGDKKLLDPWTGTIRSTADFPIQKGFALYEYVDQQSQDNIKVTKIREILAKNITDSQRITEIRAVVV